MTLGERITELRKVSGMNQSDLSKAMNVSRQAVSKWETGQSMPDAANLIRLAELLDTDIEYLTTGRRNFGRRPPVVVNTPQIVEKIVEKPVVQTVEKIVEKPVIQTVEKIIEKPVIQYVDRIVEKPVIQYIEKPVVQYVEKPVGSYRTKPVRKIGAFIAVGLVCFFLGLVIGFFL